MLAFNFYRISHFFGIVLLLNLIGCGGADANKGYTSNARKSYNSANPNAVKGEAMSKPIPVFLTTSSHLTHKGPFLVKIYEMKFETGTNSTSIYQNKTGLYLDLSHLKSNLIQKFLYIGSGSVPSSQKLTQANIIIDKEYLVLNKKGVLVKKFFEFNPALKSEHISYTLTFNQKDEVSDTKPLLIDFNLKSINKDSNDRAKIYLSTLHSSLIQKAHTQETMLFSGEVNSAIGVGTNRTFKLSYGNNISQKVHHNLESLSFESKSDLKPMVVDKKDVDIRGIFDLKKNSFLAQTIHIHEPKRDHSLVYVSGIIKKIDFQKDVISIQPIMMQGIPLDNLLIDLKLKSSSLLFSSIAKKNTLHEFMTLALPSSQIFIEGNYNKESKLLNVTWAHIEKQSTKT